MKNILTTFLVLLSVVGFSQTKTQQTKVQIDVENENGVEQYNLKLEQEVDGKTIITEKTYNSMEQMKNDPELEGINIDFFQMGEGGFSTKDGEAHVIIRIDDENGSSEGQKIIFFSDDEDGKEVNIEVTVDEDGTKHVFKNGEEIDLEELHEEGDHATIFISEDGDEDDLKALEEDGSKIMFFSKENDGEGDVKIEITIDEDGTKHVFKNGEDIDLEKLAKGQEIIFISKEGQRGDEKNVKVEVLVSKIVLHLEDVSADDKEAFSLDDNKALKLDEFNFYPNPNNGTFQLAFKGKEKATSVRVTDINGKQVYAEDLQNFSGRYDKKISLSGLKKGIYLLQVVQGNKAVNKKIVIE